MKSAPRLHTSPLLQPASAGDIPPALVPSSGGFKSAVPGVASVCVATTATTVTGVTVVATPFLPAFPRLVPHYNGNQPHLGMFSLWELRAENDPAERTIASVMADVPKHEQWLRLFQHAPALLANCTTSHSNCQRWRGELGTIVEELERIPGMEDITHCIGAIQHEMLKAAAVLDATARQVEGPPDGAVPLPLPPTPPTPPTPTAE